VGQREHSKSRAYNFFYGRGNYNHQLGTELFVHQRIVPAIKRVLLSIGCIFSSERSLV